MKNYKHLVVASTMVLLSAICSCGTAILPDNSSDSNRSPKKSSDDVSKDDDNETDKDDLDNFDPDIMPDDKKEPRPINPKPTPSSTPSPPPPTPSTEVKECHKATEFVCKTESLITAKTNSYRLSQNRTALVHDPKISFVSRDWSMKQGQRGSIGHDGFPATRNSVFLKEFGISISVAGENVAMHGGLGSGTQNDALAEKVASAFATMWWNSAGHRANMVNSGFKKIGVGVYQTSGGSWYATQIFD